MKKFLFVFLFMTFAFAASSYAQTEVVIVNNTGIDIYSIFAEDHENPEWGEDMLGEEILEPGEQLTITFPEGYSCTVDIKVSADPDDEDSIMFEEIDICEISGITLKGNGKYSVY